MLATKDDMYIHRKFNKMPGTYTRYTHACGVWGLCSWSMAAGLLAFLSRQFGLTIKRGLFFFHFTASHYFCLLSKRSGLRMLRMPPAERSALYRLLLILTSIQGRWSPYSDDSDTE